MEWHHLSKTDCIRRLKTDPLNGLTEAEARRRLAEAGRNELVQKKKNSILRRFLSQFSDFMVLILLAAAGISLLTALWSGGDYSDPVMILLIVLLNAVIGTVQECRAENAIDALKKLSSPHATVIRGGQLKTIASEELVPGDLLRITAGDLIGADARLIRSTALTTDESALTGESIPAEKRHDVVLSADTPPADRSNMLFASTMAAAGHAVAVVTETGMNTRVGAIAALIDTEDSPRTPLQRNLAHTGRILGIGALLICGLIFLLGLLQHTAPVEMFMIAISLAVAAIPEGLPAIVTIVLALGVRTMARHRAIVRRLAAVEALGSASVICSDKTGTLTCNKMTVQCLSTVDGSVSARSEEGRFLLMLGTHCCNSVIVRAAGEWHAEGSPTEKAILLAAAGAGLTSPDNPAPQRIREVPFDSRRKRMLTLHAKPDGGYRIICKGAPDVLLPLCSNVRKGSTSVPLNGMLRQQIMAENDRLAGNAMRIIAVAYRDIEALPKQNGIPEEHLCFGGLIGMTDPPRPQAKAAVAQCLKAGIRPVMITGDHLSTARAVAAELGILQKNGSALTGPELDRLPPEEMNKKIRSCSVFARVSPEHKVRIVKAFRSSGAVVAMTGDGVNDAPALKCADIGCAMGQSGTDAARSAADIILTDDNFATIVGAVRLGRTIFANIRKTIRFLLSSNIGEILTVLAAFLLRLPSPLLPIQLLWINLVTDSLPALALGSEPPEQDVMEQPPAKSTLFSKSDVRSILLEGCLIGALAFLAFTIGRVFFDGSGEPVIGRTMTFAVLSLSQLVHAFNLRSERSLLHIGFFSNPQLVAAFAAGSLMQLSVICLPVLTSVFHTAILSPMQWGIVVLLSLCPLLLCEIGKRLSAEESSRKGQLRRGKPFAEKTSPTSPSEKSH